MAIPCGPSSCPGAFPFVSHCIKNFPFLSNFMIRLKSPPGYTRASQTDQANRGNAIFAGLVLAALLLRLPGGYNDRKQNKHHNDRKRMLSHDDLPIVFRLPLG